LLVGLKTTWKVAVSPALMVGVEVEAVIAKSTMFAGGCAGVHTTVMPLLFAVAVPEIWICWAVVVIAGVMSTSTDATAPAASVEIKQGIVDPCSGPQLPEPLVTLAVGADASPVVGNPTAVKVTLEALSGPVLVILKVNAT
jgi:hypothetical protein